MLATVHRTLAASARSPLVVGSYRLDDTMLPLVLADNLGTDEDEARAVLAGSVRVLAQAAADRPVRPTPELDGELAYLLTGADSRDGSSGTSGGTVAAARSLDR